MNHWLLKHIGISRQSDTNKGFSRFVIIPKKVGSWQSIHSSVNKKGMQISCFDDAITNSIPRNSNVGLGWYLFEYCSLQIRINQSSVSIDHIFDSRIVCRLRYTQILNQKTQNKRRNIENIWRFDIVKIFVYIIATFYNSNFCILDWSYFSCVFICNIPYFWINKHSINIKYLTILITL